MKCKYCEEEIKGNRGTLTMHEKSCKVLSKIDVDKWKKNYYNGEMKMSEISKKLNVNINKLRKLILERDKMVKNVKYTITSKTCEYCNKKINSSNYKKHISLHEKMIKNKNNIINGYIDCKLSIDELSKKYGLSRPNVRKILSDNNIKLITQSDRIKYLRKNNPELYKISDETRKKISKGRKKYLKENKDKHVWKRSDKFTSEPCEHLKKILKENDINFVGEYQPLEDRFFSIDIALKDKKVGVEINGNQHYNKDKTLKKYYRERHDLITADGWKLYEVHYSKCYNDQFVKKLITLLRGDISNVDLSFEFRQKNKSKIYKCVCGKEKTRKATLCLSCKSVENRKVKNRPSYKQLLKDIEETNYTKTGEKYGVSDNAIRKWMKNYEKDEK